MADGTDIEFKLKTTGDTAGAEEVEKSIFAAQDAAKEASQQADLDIIKSKQAAEAQREQAEAARQTADATRGLVAIDVAERLTATIEKLRAAGVGGEAFADGLDAASKASTSLNAGLKTFIATGNPYLAVGAAVVTGVFDLKSAYTQMRDALDKADSGFSNVKNSMVDAATYHRELARSIKQDNLAKDFKDETEAAAALTAELRRQRELAEALESLATTRAKAGGADAGQLAVQDAAQADAGVGRDLEAARLRQAEAQRLAAIQRQTVETGADQQGVPVANVDAAKEKLHQLLIEVENATRDLANLELIGAAKVQEAGIRAAEKVTSDAEEQFTKIGQETKAKLQALASAPGAVIDESYRQAAASLSKIFEDQKVTLDEIPKLESAFRQMSQSVLANTQETQTMLGETVRQLEAARGQNGILLQRLEAIGRWQESTDNAIRRISTQR
jgi:hypothetical protein